MTAINLFDPDCSDKTLVFAGYVEDNSPIIVIFPVGSAIGAITVTRSCPKIDEFVCYGVS
jgi:hypothetical protein